MLLQLADARCHVRLDAIELVGGADHAALVHDGSEDPQGLEINHSHWKNDSSELFICPRRCGDPYFAACNRTSTSTRTCLRARSPLSALLQPRLWRWQWASDGSP